jgi:hypothetical protein
MCSKTIVVSSFLFIVALPTPAITRGRNVPHNSVCGGRTHDDDCFNTDDDDDDAAPTCTTTPPLLNQQKHQKSMDFVVFPYIHSKKLFFIP